MSHTTNLTTINIVTSDDKPETFAAVGLTSFYNNVFVIAFNGDLDTPKYSITHPGTGMQIGAGDSIESATIEAQLVEEVKTKSQFYKALFGFEQIEQSDRLNEMIETYRRNNRLQKCPMKSERVEDQRTEMGEDMRAFNAAQKEARRERLIDNKEATESLLAGKYEIEKRTHHHWSIYDHNGFRVDYYPANGKYHVVSLNKRGKTLPTGIEAIFKQYAP